MTRPIAFVASMALLVSMTPVLATPIVIIDSTPGTATNDGVVNPGEYVGASNGINGGFGNAIGSESQLHVDSSLAGELNFGLVKGSGGVNNQAVIYIDSLPLLGFADTTTLSDTADMLRSAISGNSINPGSGSELTFAPGFGADFAIGLDNGFAGLWKLAAGGNGSLIFLRSVNLTPTNTSASAGYEMNLLLSDVGLAPGDNFRYVVTYVNADDYGLYRSNEFHGVSPLTTLPIADGGGNPGRNSVTLAAGDFNTFQTIPEPGSLALSALAIVALLTLPRRRIA